MRLQDTNLLLSATDLVNFLGCTHCTALDLASAGAGDRPKVQDQYVDLLAKKGMAHEKAYLGRLFLEGRNVVEISSELPSRTRTTLTLDAMKSGADVIYQGALAVTPWFGYSDFLARVDGYETKLGNYGYEVVDTKLSRSAKPKHVIQLGVYSDLVAHAQGVAPRSMHIVLGDNSKVSLCVSDYAHYTRIARERLVAFATPPHSATTADPVAHCGLCHWKERCEGEWESTEHLGLVANMTRMQTRKLRAAGVSSMRTLAAAPPGTAVQKMQAETFERVRSQASLQISKRDGGGNKVEILPLESFKGFARLPKPDAGDLFFDMEGDPLFDGGLEYLFGFDHVDGGVTKFTPFWAHDRAQEKKAFEDAVDFIAWRLAEFPDAHVYHYANYEASALKRLAMRHGTREDEIDDLLRQRKLVDLYRVVAEGIRTSEPAYSLKNIEVFFAESRGGEVKTAGDSIVVYERWRALGLPQLLQDIGTYNEVDCKSTRACRDWLLTLRPDGIEWFTAAAATAAEKIETSEERIAREAELAALRAALVEGVPEGERGWRATLGYLLDFHRREAKPEWWELFDRQFASVEELIDDAECIGGLTRDETVAPYPMDRSLVYTFRYPPQETKLKKEDKPTWARTLKGAGEIVGLDGVTNRVALKIGKKSAEFVEPLSLIPRAPYGDKELRNAVRRYAQTVLDGNEQQYAAITSILRKEFPRADLTGGATDAIRSLDRSHLLIQGPPGAGKTYTSAHAIVQLLAEGKRVGVASFTHKAINNLLSSVERVALERGVKFRGVKKSSGEETQLNGAGLIEDTDDNKVAEGGGHQLIAGTAWLFARPALDQQLDTLFIDEAGQVSLANVVAMGVAARNIVLVGDQMQLSQPFKGTHPGGSGMSALDYLLEGHATVPPKRGIFLASTWRMHPDLCGFVSAAVYDGRLAAAPGNERQVLEFPAGEAGSAALAPSGLRFVDVEHDGCTQSSAEEAERVHATYGVLLRSHWTDRDGVRRAIGVDDILVVSPYNMQVNLLRSVLPAGARVGTVDRFQGQEAAVVLVSMTTSSGEDIPRNIEFLFSRNRLNVAISRARCLAVLFASPRLLEVTCASVGQMGLVNTLCWAKGYSDNACLA